MADFQTFDLGSILQTAAALKASQRAEQDDVLRQKYMSGQIAGQQQEQQQSATKFQGEQDVMGARQAYLQAGAILQSSDPIGTAKLYAPKLVQTYEQQNGAGSFEQATPDAVKQFAQKAQPLLAAHAGIEPEVQWQDSGSTLTPIDKHTGHPIAGLSPVAKTASPDATLSADTSRRGQNMTAATARRGQDLEGARGNKPQLVEVPNPDGTTTKKWLVPGQLEGPTVGTSPQGAKLTETQGNAKAFGLRAQDANQTLESMISGPDGYNPTGVWAMKDALTAGGVANYLASDAGQKYQNVAKAFIAPILRKESGAAISNSEWTQAKQLYIPIPGDSKTVLEQKAQNRRDAVEGLRVQAGPTGLPPVQGDTGATGQPVAPQLPPATGLVQKGTIKDIWDRPILNNPDGSISTTLSFSIGTDKGETLIPSVIDGKKLTQAEAIDHYRKTGEHLGTFDTVAHADEYAQALHNAQWNYIKNKGGAAAPVKVSTPEEALKLAPGTQFMTPDGRMKIR